MSWRRPEPETREQRLRARAKRMAAMAATTRPVGAVMGGSTSGKAIAKEEMLQHLGYMAAVRGLGFCMRCGRQPRKGSLEFCHADQGKGTGIKTDVRRGWPGCRTCHALVGSSGTLPKEERRAEEEQLGARTRAEIEKRGLWPKKLERLVD